MPGIQNFEIGHFSPTPEEEKRDPNIRKKIEAANEALARRRAEQARESLQKDLEGIPEEEQEKIKEVA